MKQVDSKSILDRFGIDYFREASIFGALPDDVILYLLDNGIIHSVKKGETIYKAGDKGNYFLVILDGSVSFFQYHNGEYAYIRDHLFGEELGFVAMVALHDRVGKAMAASDSLVLEVPSTLFANLQRENPSAFSILLLNISREMARTICDISNTIVKQKAEQNDSQ